jgi:hypothetical protein
MDEWGHEVTNSINTYLSVLVVQEHLAAVASAAPHHGPAAAAVPPAGEELKDDSTLQLLAFSGKTKQRRVDFLDDWLLRR